MSDELENRLRVLEEEFEYQDRTVETLNEVIIKQQAQIDTMQEEIRKLQEAITAVNLEDDGGNDPRPPHY